MTAPEPRVVRNPSKTAPSDSEAEARLHQEGYDSFRWTDAPGETYPRHRHEYDECIWVLQGSIGFEIRGETIELQAGDRLYLPARTPHTAIVPNNAGVTYRVGQKRPGA